MTKNLCHVAQIVSFIITCLGLAAFAKTIITWQVQEGLFALFAGMVAGIIPAIIGIYVFSRSKHS